MTRRLTTNGKELNDLLNKNASGQLSPEELRRAHELIAKPEFSDDDCRACRTVKTGNPKYNVEPQIYNLGLCQGHTSYALNTGK